MSLSRMFAGRKKERSVWQWFDYDDVQAKSTCLVIVKDVKVCGRKLAGFYFLYPASWLGL